MYCTRINDKKWRGVLRQVTIYFSENVARQISTNTERNVLPLGDFFPLSSLSLSLSFAFISRVSCLGIMPVKFGALRRRPREKRFREKSVR